MQKPTAPFVLAVGSVNPVKTQAVLEVFHDYEAFSNYQMEAVSAPSGVSEQPLTLEEMVQGAKNRAEFAWDQVPCAFSVGIESGLFPATGTQTGYLEASICSIFDGRKHWIGLSCGFEVPPSVLKLVLEQGRTLSEACVESGITRNPKLGSEEGLVGILTQNQLNRKAYTKQSVLMAVGQLLHAAWYP